MPQLDLVALIVREYEPAIKFFVNVLRFELIEDVPSLTNDGRPKRWVVVRPPGGRTGILLARADGERQQAIVGQQFAGRVGLFLRVEAFDSAYVRMIEAGVAFVSPSRLGGVQRRPRHLPQLTSQELALDQTRGHFAVHDTPHPHWKYSGSIDGSRQPYSTVRFAAWLDA